MSRPHGGEAQESAYQILGVPHDASPERVRKAYLTKVRLFPPEEAPERFKAIRKAYGQLKDGAQRRALDLSLFRKQSGLKIPPAAEVDAVSMFRRRVLRLLLSSSDLFIADFHAHFEDIDDSVDERGVGAIFE